MAGCRSRRARRPFRSSLPRARLQPGAAFLTSMTGRDLSAALVERCSPTPAQRARRAPHVLAHAPAVADLSRLDWDQAESWSVVLLRPRFDSQAFLFFV